MIERDGIVSLTIARPHVAAIETVFDDDILGIAEIKLRETHRECVVHIRDGKMT